MRSKLVCRSGVFLVALSVSFFNGRAADENRGRGLPVVADGKPSAVIVRNSEGGAVVGLAVAELRSHIESITGVRLPVVSAADWDGSVDGTAIIIGRGDALETLGFEVGDLPPEGYRIRSLPERRALVLAGRDSGNPLTPATLHNLAHEYGTLYAVYDLLEYWGVRWLFYGDLGTIIPRESSLVAPDWDKVDGPDFRMRNHWLVAYDPEMEVVERREIRSDDPVRKKVARESLLWALRNRAGNSLDVYRGRHHSPSWWSLWSESNPEYLGLYRGQRGIRRSPPGTGPDRLRFRSKLCVGNPDVAKAVADLAKDRFRESPDTPSYSICEQDGSPGFCECPLCTALDIYREGETVKNAPLTDRYMHFWNLVAEQVSEEFPDRTLAIYIYQHYNELPRSDRELHPLLRGIFAANGEVEPVSLRRRIEGWSKLTPNPLALYTHPMHGAWPVQDFSRSAFPALTLANVLEGIRFCRSLGVVGFTKDGRNFGTDNAGSHGLLSYAYARWLWDADLEPEEIVDDFTRHGFGAAAPHMRAFFTAIDQRQMSYPRENGRAAWLEHHLQVFTAEFVAECLERLDAAAKSASTEADRARVEIFRHNMLYTSAEMELERSWRLFTEEKCDADAVRRAYENCREIFERLPPETKPARPMFEKGDAARTALLSVALKPLKVLLFEDWEMCADPMNIGLERGWQRGVAGQDWLRTTNSGYDMQGFWGTDTPVWYRVFFRVPEGARSAGLRLAFAVNNTSADVFLNGEKVGSQILGERHYREPELGGAGELVAHETGADGMPVYNIGRQAIAGGDNNLMVRIMGYTDRGVLCQNAWLLEER